MLWAVVQLYPAIGRVGFRWPLRVLRRAAGVYKEKELRITSQLIKQTETVSYADVRVSAGEDTIRHEILPGGAGDEF
jgi:hypothetical protein